MEESKFSIKITPKAYEDLDEIYDYIANNLYNESAAENLLDKIEMGLKFYPFSCSFVRDELLRGKGYRKLIIENYIVFYIVREDARLVIIMRVLYNKQKYQDLI